MLYGSEGMATENEGKQEAVPGPDWSTTLEWAEKSGLENLKTRHDTLGNLRKEASSTLTLLLAGLAGSLAYAAKLFEPGAAGPVAFGAGAVCIWLTGLALYLVFNAMLFLPVPAIYNEPKGLAQPEFTLDELRHESLNGLQERIDEIVKINDKLADVVNWTRALAAILPGIFVVAAIGYIVSNPAPQPSSGDPLKLQCKAVAQAAASDPQLACRLAP
jgi:hypothetical protein